MTATVCSGAAAPAAADACDGRACVPDTDDLCAYRDGDPACPATYPTKRIYHRNVADSRGCTACTRQPGGAPRCQIELEICSISFFDVTLDSSGEPFCHNSGGGDGTKLLSTQVND